MKNNRPFLFLLLSLLLALALLFTGCDALAGEKGDKGDKGDPGEQGAQGPAGADGTSPKLQINADTGMWEISYDGGKTWTSLGVRAQGEQGVAGANGTNGTNGKDGKDGKDGTQITIGENGNWFLDGVDTGMKATTAEAGSTPKEFVPILRFAVTSDLHLRSYATEVNDYKSHDMLDRLYTTAYAYSESQPYNKLDAIFFAGDFTQSGLDDEFGDFFDYVNAHTKAGTVTRAVLGNHEFYATSYDDGTTSDERYSDTSVAATFEKYKSYGGYDEVDAHLVIGGYHFLVLNMDRYSYDYTGSKFSPKKLAWLETELGIAAADDPTGKKPIFVFQHMPATATVNNASQKASDDYLEEIFSKFPQVVDFSGHTHQPITQPQSIWQGGYTAINTGSLAYLGVPISGHPDYDSAGVRAMDNNGTWANSGSEEEIRNAGLYYFVEVNADYELRLVVYNVFSDSAQAIIAIGGVGDASKFTYNSQRKYSSKAPYFDSAAAITPQLITKNYALLNIPQASCEVGVNNYRVELYQGSSKVATTYRLSCGYLGFAMPATVSAPLKGLTPSTSYTVKVYPVSTWGKVGEPLTYTFLTDTSSAAPVADVLSTQFNLDGTAVNAVTGKALHTAGAPTVAHDTALERNVASFDGDSGYCFTDMYGNYDLLTDGFTIETYVYLDSIPSVALDIFANLESGGFGLEQKPTGELQFLCRTAKNGYERIGAAMPTGRWVHVIGTFDGTTLKLYFDSVEMASLATANTTWSLPKSGAQYVCVGGDSTLNSFDGNNHIPCKIAAANLYSEALTAAEILALYASYQ